MSKFGVDHFAKEAGVAPATARVLLRNGNIKKEGRSYGWDSMAEVKKAVEKCRKSSPAKEKPTKKKSKKPAKKAAKKTAPKKKAPTENNGEE